MPLDPTDPEIFDDTYADTAYEEEPEGTENPEATEADAAEQHADLLRQRDEPLAPSGSHEADPADAAEQARVVELNEDEYR
ncbi:hypothetical protein [Streptomyces sp. PU-14G]|uniref:hypothetical protein n=1 Tax=Streptomyces sp. PU-14G TaxID=2800808 RepID=UPI0034DF2DC2